MAMWRTNPRLASYMSSSRAADFEAALPNVTEVQRSLRGPVVRLLSKNRDTHGLLRPELSCGIC